LSELDPEGIADEESELDPELDPEGVADEESEFGVGVGVGSN
jgi:hypothetical protein